MKNNPTPHIAVSQTADVLIIQGTGGPVLFVPQVSHLFEKPSETPAITIVDVGAAAIETVIAAGAKFDSETKFTEEGLIASVTLRFTLQNGLCVGYTTDEELASDRAYARDMGIHLMVTNDWVQWVRKHSEFIGRIIARVPAVPPQIVGFTSTEQDRLVPLIREALQNQKQGKEGA